MLASGNDYFLAGFHKLRKYSYGFEIIADFHETGPPMLHKSKTGYWWFVSPLTSLGWELWQYWKKVSLIMMSRSLSNAISGFWYP